MSIYFTRLILCWLRMYQKERYHAVLGLLMLSMCLPVFHLNEWYWLSLFKNCEACYGGHCNLDLFYYRMIYIFIRQDNGCVISALDAVHWVVVQFQGQAFNCPRAASLGKTAKPLILSHPYSTVWSLWCRLDF